jgi:hypothetical protein
MASAEDLMEKLDAVIKAVEELDKEFTVAGDEARDLIEAAQALGHDQAITDFTQILDSLEVLGLPLKEVGPEVEKVRKAVEEITADKK